MRYTIAIICIFIIWGCDDNSVIPPGSSDVKSGDVLVVNEGGFQRGNASLGLYNIITNTYQARVFEDVNGAPVGDVLQTIVARNDEYWVIVNNSGKIVVLDSADLSVKHTITGFKSPRHIKFYQSKAFVSDLYANEVAVVNTTSYRIDNFIPIEGWTDQMDEVGGKLYVANRERPFVFVIDPNSETVLDSIEVAHNPNSLTALGNDYVAILCEGRLGSSDPSKFQLILTDSAKVIKDVTVDVGGKPSLLRISPANGNIYFAYKGIHYIHPVSFTLEDKIIDLPGANVYGFDIDPVTGNFYVSDAKDYVKKSDVYVYKNGESKLSEFEAGVICNGFVFR